VAVHLTMPLSAGAGRLRRLHRWRLAPLPAGSARRPGSVPDPSLSLPLSLRTNLSALAECRPFRAKFSRLL
jgi:hypothetical protein